MSVTLKIEYEETYVDTGQPLEVTAEGAAHVTILDVTQIGSQYRYRYTVTWENGDN